MYRLAIDGELVEGLPTFKVFRKILNISNLEERGVRFTNAVNLQPTGHNLRLCGSPQYLATNNDSFEQSPRYTLSDENGIVSQGRIILKSYSKTKGIKIQLTEGLDLWAQAEKKQLNNLILHGDDFQFNGANMDALKVRTSGVFLTALHDAVGDKTNTALVDYNYTRPVYIIRNLLDAIAADLGYSINYGDTLSNTKINSIGFPSNCKDFFVSDYKYRFEGTDISGGLTEGAGSQVFDLGTNVTEAAGVFTNSTYKTGYVFKGTIYSNFDTQIVFTFSDRTEILPIRKGTHFYNFKTDASEIGTTLQVASNEAVTLDDVYFYSIVSEGDVFDITGSINIDGWHVLADYNLPNLTYKSLFKLVFKLFFLSNDEDQSSKELDFVQLGNALDINNVIDLSGRVQITNKEEEWNAGSIYGRLNWMGYANDEDVSEDLGRFYFDGLNENAQAVKSLIKVDEFSASNEVSVSGERVVQFPVYNLTENKRSAVSDRLVYLNEVVAFGFNATFAELGFARLHSDHYVSFVEATRRERVLSLDVLLRYSEFVVLHRNPLIYVSEYSSLFLVTEIKGFEAGQLTKIEVVKYG